MRSSALKIWFSFGGTKCYLQVLGGEKSQLVSCVLDLIIGSVDVSRRGMESYRCQQLWPRLRIMCCILFVMV